MHDLDPPMIAIDAQQRLWRGGGGQAGDEIDDLVLWLLPLAVLLDLARTYDATDLPNRRPLALIPAASAGSTSIARHSMRPCAFSTPLFHERRGKNRLVESRFDVLA